MSLTKKDLSLIAGIVEEVVERKLEEKLEQKLEEKLARFVTREELDEKLAELRNDFYNKVDPFLAEIETARMERAVTAARLDNHEHRLGIVEQSLSLGV